MSRKPDFPREEDYPQLSLEELEREIRRVTVNRSISPNNAYWRKTYEGMLFKLDKLRQQRLQERE